MDSDARRGLTMPSPTANRQPDDEWCDCCKEGCACGDCAECTEQPLMDRPIRPRESARKRPGR